MKKVILVTGLLCALASPVAAADTPAPSVGKMDALIQSYADSEHFMGAVLVVRDGNILLDKAYGYANLEWRTPMTTDARFRIGSMTKQFTAASILLLEERGKLNTDDLLSKYLPGLPAAWEKVTLKNLLTHTSGIPSYTSAPNILPLMLQPSTPDQLIAVIRDKPLDFPTDSKYAYSNTNYVLLGMVVEKVSGQSYAGFVKDNIFTPLHMADSGYDLHTPILPYRALGYQPGPWGLENADYVDTSGLFSAGALYSTTHDLRLWEDGLFGGKLLKPESLTKMTTPYKNGYAFGLNLRGSGGHRLFEHGGSVNGARADMAWYPDDKLMIIVLSNIQDDAPSGIRTGIEGILDGKDVPLQVVHKQVAVGADILAAYPGTYEVENPKLSFVVTLENGQLFAAASTGKKLPFFPESDTKFFAKPVNIQFEFVRDANGKVTSAIVHNGSQVVTAVRK